MTTRSIKLSLLTLTLCLFAAFGLFDSRARAFVNGPPASHTGAPGEGLCTSCHTSFPPDSGAGFVLINGLPNNYAPGQVVPLSITVRHFDGFLYGFQLTAIDANGAQAGTLVVTDTANTQSLSSTVGGNPRSYLEHTFAGSFPVEFNQRTWSFNWIAPQNPVGAVTFYAAGNGANGDQESTGDHIYTTQISTGCGFGLSAAAQNFAALGGTGSVQVNGAGCNWTAISRADWVTITSGDRGTGGGTVAFTVDPNPSTTANRVGTITIGTQTFTVRQGAAFLDVPVGHLFYTEIGKLSAAGITQGCGGGNYCPAAIVTREQMAAFIIRALGDFNPPPPAMQRFNDVPPSNIFYAFIEQLAVRQITLGCGGGNYCPGQPVTREQMAAFIIRALGEFDPPTPGSQRYEDVPPTNIFYDFIDRMAVLGITQGCSTSPPRYCPTANVTREQMAAFLVRAFNL